MTRLHRRLAAVAAVVLAPLTLLAVRTGVGHACCDPNNVVVNVNGTICWEGTGPQPAPATGGDPTDLTAVVTVSLSRRTTVPVTVVFNTADATALAPGDYEAIVNLEVTIPAGQRAVKVAVKIKKDEVREPDEWFLVTIAKPSVGKIGKGEDRVIILGDLPAHDMTAGDRGAGRAPR